ncbi:MAG: sigma-70 family RNA polymerase sigma factor [Acidobacteria bacterium]|nr:sigma-70 family RNA polymerase sigma factor [Acidobacteriota bacterium]
MAQHNDIAGFELLFEEQYAPLCRYVYRMVGSLDDTLEIVQESFLRLWQSGQNIAPAEQPALLFRLARNHVIDLLRRRNVRERLAREAAGQVLMMPADPERTAMGNERLRLAEAVLQELDPRQREVLRLRAFGFSYSEIATILGLNPESIGPTLTRGLRKFRLVHEEKSANRRPLRGYDETSG